MSIAGIDGAVSSYSSGYSSGYGRRGSATVEGGYGNLTTGPDTVSFSEAALQMSQNRTANSLPPKEDLSSSQSKLPADQTQRADTSASSLSTLGKSSLFSMLLENLFFADLEESAANSSDAAQGTNEQAGEDGVQRQQQPRIKSASPLEDGGKVAEIKKLLNDVATGKTSLSELPKVMAGSGAASQKTGSAPKSEVPVTARPATESTNTAIS